MKRLLAVALLLLAGWGSSRITPSVRAQTTDDFSDGNLLDPEWTGDVGAFVVADGRLRLRAADRESPATLGLAAPVPAAADTLTYEFLVEMDFAPSASNFVEIELTEGDPPPGGGLTGARLTFGGESGDGDALSVGFFRDGEPVGEPLRGRSGALGAAPALVRFRLQRARGRWTLATDYDGGRNFTPEATTDAAPSISPNHLTLRCHFTPTRADRFSFDDLAVRFSAAPPDVTPPALTEVTIRTATEVRLRFSEPVAADPLTDPGNYSFAPVPLTVSTAVVAGRSVDLVLADPLPLREERTLTIAGARDLANNEATGLTAPLRYDPTVPPAPGRVTVTEFMADPNPAVGWPDAEYVELHNPTDTAVTLTGLEIASGGSPVSLPEGRLPAGGYLLLTRPAAVAAFSNRGVPVVGLALPTLSNGGDEIRLSVGGADIFRIEYTEDWYNDPQRDGGGYSLEFTGGADAGCGGRWRASLDPTGGTPGRENSVLGLSADTVPPAVEFVEIDPDGITVSLTEASAGGIPGFTVAGPATVAGITAREAGNVFRIGFTEELREGERYVLTVPPLTDCAGNRGSARNILLGLPGTPGPGDVVINELLFNPGVGGEDFVELYNCSDRIFQVAGWVLRNDQRSGPSASRTVTGRRLLFPGDHLTLTAEPADLLARYREVNPELLLAQALPALPDEAGNLSLLAGGLLLDAFDYSADLHAELLATDDGVSLERLRPKAPTQDANNWFSAAAAAGFATPTRANSQRRDSLATGRAGMFSLATTTFSPDGDGFEDFLELRYRTDRPGYLARIRVFDAQGRPVRTLRPVELLAGAGTIRWDGSTDEGRRARSGIHVLLVETFAAGLAAHTEKLVAVLR